MATTRGKSTEEPDEDELDELLEELELDELLEDEELDELLEEELELGSSCPPQAVTSVAVASDIATLFSKEMCVFRCMVSIL